VTAAAAADDDDDDDDRTVIDGVHDDLRSIIQNGPVVK